MKKVFKTLALTALVGILTLTSCSDEDPLHFSQDIVYLPQDTMYITNTEPTKQLEVEAAINQYLKEQNPDYTYIGITMSSKIKDVDGYNIYSIKCAISWEYKNGSGGTTNTYYVSEDLKVISSIFDENIFYDYKITN